MPIYQRGKSKTWWIDITTADGERIRKSSGTQDKQQAQELHDKLKAESWRVKSFGDKPRYIWQDAVLRWLSEQGHKKSIDDDKKLFRWLHQYLVDKDISVINKQFIDFLKAEKLKSGVTNASVNRMLALLKSVLNRAKNEWEWIDVVPYIKLLPEAEKRVRWLTKHESVRLLNELPEHLNLMARFTLSTGLRESNVVGLQWSQVDMVRRCAWIHPEESKSGQGIAVPLDDNACAIIMSQFGKHQTHVFTYEGNSVTRANNRAWRNALKRAKIDDFRWHDLRHTWASWHIQNGTPIQVLQQLGGWSDMSMVLRYAHLSSEHLREYAGNASVTNLSQAIKKAQVEST